MLELDDEDFFVKRHRYDAEGLEYLRYMAYHPRSAEDDARAGNIWARGHSDYNTLTFLFHQPIAGLQVQSPDGKWRYVRSPRDAVIVNIADALEFLSGGYLKSTVHRVVRPPEDQAGQSRLSLIYFARPEANIVLEPVRSPLLERIGLGERSEKERFAHQVTAEGMLRPLEDTSDGIWANDSAEWARARIAKDHRFRVGIVDAREKEIIAGVHERFYD